jgi:uncharacterized SAM-binding protein YcdF (DUF218 family)
LKAWLGTFLLGTLFGGLFVLVSGILFLRYAPFLLIVNEPAEQADIAVVLGGGGGSRLRKGLSLYESGKVNHLVLVDKKKNAWDGMLHRFCPNCAVTGKVTILEGSQNTFTDAELLAEYCRLYNIKKILVVTDPYHTRRAFLVFNNQFAKSGIEVSVISSGEFGSRLSPEGQWWRDDNTAKTIWAELTKVLIIFLRKYEFCTD